MNSVFILFYLIVAVTAYPGHNTKIKENAELKKYIPELSSHGDDINIVPVIHGYHREKRDHRVLQLTRFNESVTLYLEPNDGYLAGSSTQVFMARADPTEKLGVRFDKIHNVMKTDSVFFHDKYYLAALLIKHDKEGKPLIHGTIGDIAIRPLPRQMLQKFSKRHKRSVHSSNGAESSCIDCSEYHEIEYTHNHVITKINSTDSPKSNDRSRKSRSIERRIEHSLGQQPVNPKVNVVPPVTYPQLLITVESSLFDIFHQNVDATVEYILSYWNGVDLRYRAFLEPKIRLNIAAIVLAKDPGATPYVADNLVKIEGYQSKRQLLHSHGVLTDEPRYFYNETYYNDKNVFLWMNRLKLEFDMAVTMTANDLCDFEPKCIREDGVYECTDKSFAQMYYCSSLGSAFYTGACACDPKDEKMEAFAILEDLGNFASIVPSAHEVGHLLGASHSLSNKHHCSTNDGYIMSYRLKVSDQVFEWANCSVYSIKSFLEEEKRARCLFNKPNVMKRVPNILPGEVYSRDELCYRIMKTKSCDEKRFAEDCVQLYCMNENGYCNIVVETPVPEGLSCGDNKHCINAQCINKQDSIVKLEIGTTPRSNKWHHKVPDDSSEEESIESTYNFYNN